MQNLVCITGIASTFFLGISCVCVCAGVCIEGPGVVSRFTFQTVQCDGPRGVHLFVYLRADSLTQGLKHSGQAPPWSCCCTWEALFAMCAWRARKLLPMAFECTSLACKLSFLFPHWKWSLGRNVDGTWCLVDGCTETIWKISENIFPEVLGLGGVRAEAGWGRMVSFIGESKAEVIRVVAHKRRCH